MILFEEKKDCCGCGACVNICPRSAITMQEDECGYMYPVIDNHLCVDCGLCKKVCGYQTPPQCNAPIACYAAAAKDDETLMKAASGGAFSVFAIKILREGGVVYGSAMHISENTAKTEHVRIEQETDLYLLQGSKYVQSRIGDTYKKAKEDLNAGRKVLFSGTPCQIAGLQSYLNKEYDNLLTVDLICHGVPNAKIFGDFLCGLAKKLHGEILSFSFRDKSKGQAKNMRIHYLNAKGQKDTYYIDGDLLSYGYFFSKSYLHRENCYSCKFACAERTADITVGDFWGFHAEYPGVSEESGLSNQKGISCVLLNTQKGIEFWNRSEELFHNMEAAFDKIARHNKQLNNPTIMNGAMRGKLLEIYKTEGYCGIDTYYRKHFIKDKFKYRLSAILPKTFKRSVKRLVGFVSER